MNKKLIIFLIVVLFIGGIGMFLFQVSRSRTYQVFGEVYPRIETPQKVIALTFDDGPTKENTDEILQILQEENIKATFYLMGSGIEQNLSEAERIIAAGHEIGNHTFHREQMLLVSPNFVKSEIEKTDELIRKAGYQGEITFRPPYGKKLFVLPWYLSANHRKTITWDVEPETYFSDSENIIKNTLENTKNGSIILLHVMYKSRAESMKSVRPIIKSLKEKGFEFTTVSKLISLK